MVETDDREDRGDDDDDPVTCPHCGSATWTAEQDRRTVDLGVIIPPGLHHPRSTESAKIDVAYEVGRCDVCGRTFGTPTGKRDVNRQVRDWFCRTTGEMRLESMIYRAATRRMDLGTGVLLGLMLGGGILNATRGDWFTAAFNLFFSVGLFTLFAVWPEIATRRYVRRQRVEMRKEGA